MREPAAAPAERHAPPVRQAGLTDAFDQSPRVRARQAAHATLNGSPRMAAQRRRRQDLLEPLEQLRDGLDAEHRNRRSVSSGAEVIQGRFDARDIARMRAVARGDRTLTAILNELLAIHDAIPEDLNYGVSSKGGDAGLDPATGRGRIRVKDERWSLTRAIKDYFDAYGMEHDIQRQSMIIHELTHLAELYVNLPSEGGVVPESHRPKSDRELAQSMEPDRELVDRIYGQKSHVEGLLRTSGYDDDLKRYLFSRLEYGFAINAENPTVFTEICYYLKAKGKAGTPFYDKMVEFAGAFFESRAARRERNGR